MDYCGYAPRFGFRIEKARHYGSTFDDLKWKLESARDGGADENTGWGSELEYNEELPLALTFLRRHDPSELVWIDASSSALEFSVAREFVAVLRCEAILCRLKVINDLGVMLNRNDPGDTVIEMHLARVRTH
ncbi:hypothetical protein SAMN05216566_11223 [Aureimonas phyllosphaerae]|nr:hypothetical protein SAMN05216566_11223 [Aureimonas phyllosphaerae]